MTSSLVRIIPLAKDSVEEIKGLLDELLEGQTFASVVVHSGNGRVPEITTGQKLRLPGRDDARLDELIAFKDEGALTGLAISGSEATWLFFTTLARQDEYDPQAGTPHFSFHGRQVTIAERNGDYVVLAVQE